MADGTSGTINDDSHQSDCHPYVVSPSRRHLLGRAFHIAYVAALCWAGLAFAGWLLELERFDGTLAQWIGVFAFPLMAPLYFYVDYRFGCASGVCRPALDETAWREESP